MLGFLCVFLKNAWRTLGNFGLFLLELFTELAFSSTVTSGCDKEIRDTWLAEDVLAIGSSNHIIKSFPS